MQQVNLYTEAFRPRREVLSLAHVLYATLGFILILAALGYALTYWSGTLQNELEQSTVKLEAIRAQTNALEAQAALVKRDESLVRGNRFLREKIIARKEMLGALGTVAVRESSGFSHYLVGLARYSLKSLWLTRIALSDAGNSMMLEGKTAEAKLVPEYLGLLNSEEVFSGRSFEMFDLHVDEQRAGLLNFLLQSKALEPISVLVAKSGADRVLERVGEEAESAR